MSFLSWLSMTSLNVSFFFFVLLRDLLLSVSHAHTGTRPRTDDTQKTNSYYAQRAAAGGLIISEATNICPGAQGES